MNVQVPLTVTPGNYQLSVTYNGAVSPTVPIQVFGFRPNYVEYVSAGRDCLAVVHTDTVGSLVTGQNPAQPGEIVMIFLTGLGNGKVDISVNGASAEVLYAGPQGTYPGLDQINLRIPEAGPAQQFTIQVSDGTTSQKDTFSVETVL